MRAKVRGSTSSEFFACPSCGAEVRVGSSRCFRCQPQRSWEQDEACDGLDLPDSEEDWDYEDFVRREFDAGGRPPGTVRIRPIWVVVAVGLVLVMLWTAVARA